MNTDNIPSLEKLNKDRKSTNLNDRGGNEIFEGDTVRAKNIEGKWINWTIQWSEWGKTWEGENPGEIYHLGPTLFSKSVIVTQK